MSFFSGKDLTCSPSPPPFELKSLCERLRQKTCKCHDVSRNKRKYSSADGKSKRARIEISYDESEDTECKGTSIGERYPSSSAKNHGINDCRSPGKRQGLRSSGRIETFTAPIDNNEVHRSNSVSSVGATRPELKSESISNYLPGDCHCIPDSAYDLLSKCLKLDPAQRISASDALNHLFLTS